MTCTARFSVTIDGHSATVTLVLAGGLFSGIIDSPEYGSGIIRDGVQTGNELKGTVSLKGYDCDFSARLDGENVSPLPSCASGGYAPHPWPSSWMATSRT